MTRLEEYQVLLSQDETPEALSHTVHRVQKRCKRAKLHHLCTVPVATLVASFTLFVLLVNVSIPFASACSNIPFLKELVEAVAYEPSLTAAVNNEYVQTVNQTQTVGDVTVTVEYIIVDEQQINLFYTLHWDEEDELYTFPELVDENDQLQCSSYANGYAQQPWGEYRMITYHILEGDIPSTLDIRFDVHSTSSITDPGDYPVDDSNNPWPDQEEGRDPLVASLSFQIPVDLTAIAPPQILVPQVWIELDGQSISVDTVAIHPTHTKVTFTERPDNTLALRSLSFYLEDELGNRYDMAPMSYATEYFLDTPYFYESEHLTLHITKALWEEREDVLATIDLTTGKTTNLPKDITLSNQWHREGDTVYLAFDMTGSSTVGNSYVDPDGLSYYFGAHSISSSSVNDISTAYYTLTDYPWDSVTIPLSICTQQKFDPPRSLPIK